MRLKVRRMQCDNGGEFSTNNFKEYCYSNGINIEYSQPYAPSTKGSHRKTK